MEQRSEEWHLARKGKMTCSRMAEAVGLIGSRRRLWRELTGREGGVRTTEWMTDGINYEQVAVNLYEEVTKNHIIKAGFLNHRDHDWIGGSPDALVREIVIDRFGGLEVKCPKEMYENEHGLAIVPDYYMPQMQGLMEVADLAWWDFMVWTPDSYVITRVDRNPEYWRQLYELLCDFWTFVEADVEPPVFKRGTKPRITASVLMRVLHQG